MISKSLDWIHHNELFCAFLSCSWCILPQIVIVYIYIYMYVCCVTVLTNAFED